MAKMNNRQVCSGNVMIQVLEKIKKLLRLSRSANMHEAALAMTRAMELAEKHGLDISQMNMDDNHGRITHERFSAPSRLAYEYKLAIAVAEDYFRVRVIIDRGGLIYIGESMRIAVASYVLEFMIREARRNTSSLRLRGKKRRGYLLGFFVGIRRALDVFVEKAGINRHDQADALETYQSQNFRTTIVSTTLTSIARHRSAFTLGFIAGSNVSVMPACEGATRGMGGFLEAST